MLLNDAMLESQRNHAEASLKTATRTARWTALAVVVGAFGAWYSANLTAKATIEAVKMQIASDQEVAKIEASKPVPPINVVVQVPEGAIKKRSER